MKKKIYKFAAVILALLVLASCVTHSKGVASSASASAESSTPTQTERKWILGKAVIPENNPEPVLVDREDAATPTPISFTDIIVKNKMNLDV